MSRWYRCYASTANHEEDNSIIESISYNSRMVKTVKYGDGLHTVKQMIDGEKR